MSPGPTGSGEVGGYRLLEEAGRGRAAVVYKAAGPDGQVVALKLFVGLPSAQRARLETEVRTLLRLRHPQVVSLLDAGSAEGTPYLVMEWVAGESLQARLRRQGPLPPREAAALIEGLARALEHCHQQGVLHRDLTPGNVLLRATRGLGRVEPLLVDFGQARDLEVTRASSGTAEGDALGTPNWWPPEQARGDLQRIGPRSDVYGLGALLYACLTARAPYQARSALEAAAAAQHPPVPPRRLAQDVPAGLEAICLRALRLDPAGRPSSAGALADELAAWREGRAPSRAPALGLAIGALLVGALLAALPVVTLPRGPAAGGEPGLASAAPLASSEAPGAIGRVGSSTASTALGTSGQARDPGFEPRDADGWLERARALSAGQDSAGALAALDRALALAPGEGRVWAERGALRGRLRAAGARADLDRALELDPALTMAWCARGQLRASQGDRAGALEDLLQATRLAPDQPAVWDALGAERLAQADHQGAADAWTRALALEPGRVSALRGRGQARRELGLLEAAQADLDRAVTIAPRDAEARGERAHVRKRRGDLQGALEDARRAAELAPELASSWYRLGVLLGLTGDKPEAARCLDRSLRIDPAQGATWCDLAVLRGAMGDLPGAVDGLRRAVAVAPEDADFHANLGAALRETRDLDGALEHLGRAVALDARLQFAWYNRGLVHSDRKAWDLAVADFTRALELDPQDAQARLRRAIALREGGDPRSAIADLDLLLEARPRSWAAWSERAEARLSLGDAQGALSDLERALELVGANPSRRAPLEARAAKLRASLASPGQGG